VDQTLQEHSTKRTKRFLSPTFFSIGAPILGVIIGLLIGALLIMMAGSDPIGAYRTLYIGAFGGSRQRIDTILQAGPILLIGLGLSAAFKAKVWNIGAEGQYFMGALLGGVIGLFFPNLPRPLLIITIIIGGLIGGSLWALIPAVLKMKQGVNEIISTLMLNYIAILFMTYLTRGPLQDPNGYLPVSAQLDPVARLPRLFDTRIHIGILIGLVLVPLVYALLWSTPLGFKLRAVGERSSVAKYAGVHVGWMITFALIFSGALAGLAGAIEVSGVHARLKPNISVEYGFSGILVALLGRMNPFGVAMAALFFAGLGTGVEAMHSVYKLPVALAQAVQAIIVLSVLAVDALAQRRKM
jgi:simple sugar transport system permease protein